MSEKEDAPKEIVGYRQQPGKLPFSRPGSGGKGKFSESWKFFASAADKTHEAQSRLVGSR